MSIKISEVVDLDELSSMLEQGFVKRQKNEDGKLYIYNYTARAQYEKLWNNTTLSCRGLITDSEGVILARPFNKFYNLEEEAEYQDLTGPVMVTDKLDGSLGILYEVRDGQFAIATRGSFSSDQAKHATIIWNLRYQGRFTPVAGVTYLFEIIYPENRIVVSYEDLDDLVLIAAIENKTGRTLPLDAVKETWPGPAVEEFNFTDLSHVLTAQEREGREGFVVYFPERDLRIKIKQAEYVRLHRLITGVSARRIWEVISVGDSLSSWLEAVPDEFYNFVTQTEAAMRQAFDQIKDEIKAEFGIVLAGLNSNFERKDFAKAVFTNQSLKYPHDLFLFLDQDFSLLEISIWKKLRPAEHNPNWQESQ